MSLIVGITGLAGAGKDTIGSHLVRQYGFERRAFADKLKQLARAMNPVLEETVDAFGWEMAKKIPQHREYLQDLGHGARQIFGDDFWVDRVFVDIPENMVLTDLRYPNEFARVKDHGGVIIRVTRPGLEPVNSHVTEIGHGNIPVDYSVINLGGLDELFKQVDYVMGLNGVRSGK